MIVNVSILHVAETVQGGIASYLDEINPLQRETYGPDNVHLLIPAGQGRFLTSLTAGQLTRFKRGGRNPASFFNLATTLRQTVKKRDPAIIHLHGTFAGLIGRLTLMTIKHRARIVYCPHGWAFLMDIPTWRRWLYAQTERFLAPFCDLIINISAFEHKRALTHKLPKRKCITIKNAIRKDAREYQPVSLEHRLNLLFIGRHDRQKGLDILLNVMRRLQKHDYIHLYVIGDNVHGRKLRKLTTPPNVTLLGWLKREELNGYYAAADAVIMPSRWEGFGLVALEAMRMSTPVIAAKRGALPELISHGQTGYLFNLDKPSELANLLNNLEIDTLQRMGLHAREAFEANFTAPRLHKELDAAYRKLLEQKR